MSAGAWDAMIDRELRRIEDALSGGPDGVIRSVPGIAPSAPVEPVTFSSQAGLASIRRPILRSRR